MSKRLAARWASPVEANAWVFVVGCYNSGTTLLADMLREHPEVNSPGQEGVFLTDRLPHPEALGWPRMWVECEDEISLSPESLLEEDVNRIRRQWGMWAKRPGGYFVEKSIALTPNMEILQRAFPPAYFIHIVRNGFAVAEGICRKSRPGDRGNHLYDRYPIEMCANQWAVSQRRVHQAMASLENFLEITYEDLTEKPDETMRQVTDFLGMSPIQTEFSEPRQVHEVKEVISNMNARSLARLTEEDYQKIVKTAGVELERAGYL